MGAGIISVPLPLPPPPPPITTTTTVTVAAAMSSRNDNKSIDDAGNAMVVIYVKGNPQPFAIGRSLLRKKKMTMTTMDNNKPYG